MITKTDSHRGHAAGGGALAGIVGGIAISIVLVIAAITKGQDIWPVFKVAGAPFLGERALEPGFALGPVVIGVGCHFAVSIVWGVLFGVLFYGLSKPATFVVGAMWGVVVWGTMYYLVLPVAGVGHLTSGAPIGAAILEHVIFGLAVALGFMPFQRTRIMTPAVSSAP